jgi:hypothetical protein
MTRIILLLFVDTMASIKIFCRQMQFDGWDECLLAVMPNKDTRLLFSIDRYWDFISHTALLIRDESTDRSFLSIFDVGCVAGVIVMMFRHHQRFVVLLISVVVGLASTTVLAYVGGVSPFLSFRGSSTTGFTRNAVRTPLLYAFAETKREEEEGTDDDTFLPLLKLASAHCASQALYTLVQLGIPDILGSNLCTLQEISNSIGPTTNTDALLRTMRLLTTVGILNEHDVQDGGDDTIAFSLTKTGHALRTDKNSNGSMAPCIQHWMERPLWMSWLELPDYIRGEGYQSLLPFDRANEGISSDFYYNAQDHPESLQRANAFVRLVHEREMQAVVQGFDWASLGSQRVVDVGGHYGTVMAAIAKKHPQLDCYSLDLPEVVASAPTGAPAGVQLVGGNIFDSSTIPKCHVILMKHFLDRCMWTEDESVAILQSCADTGAKVIVIAEAVLPDIGHNNTNTDSQHVSLYMDALYMLVGREGQRTQAEWGALATQAGFRVRGDATPTLVPSCSILVLEREE